jgi:hypothetical protein
MNALLISDPDWLKHLRVAVIKSEVVVIDGSTGQDIVTADRASAKSVNAVSAHEYATMIIASIQSRLKGIKLC